MHLCMYMSMHIFMSVVCGTMNVWRNYIIGTYVYPSNYLYSDNVFTAYDNIIDVCYILVYVLAILMYEVYYILLCNITNYVLYVL